MSEMTVEDAEQEATEAESLATELEERVRQGDLSVTPDSIADAERLGKFARLRVEAAQRKADERRKTDARERAEEFKARLIEQAEANDAEVVEAWSVLIEALRDLRAKADRRGVSVDEQVAERGQVGAELRAAGLELTEFGILPGRYHGDDGYQIKNEGMGKGEGIDIRYVQTHEYVAEALALSLSASIIDALKRTGTDAERPQELHKSTRITAVIGWPEAARKAVESQGAK